MARTKQVARFRVDESGNVVPMVRPMQAAAERMGLGVPTPIQKTKKAKEIKEPKEPKSANQEK